MQSSGTSAAGWLLEQAIRLKYILFPSVLCEFYKSFYVLDVHRASLLQVQKRAAFYLGIV